MYNATDLLLFRIYILLGMRIGKHILRIIVLNVLQIVVINVHHPLPRNLKQYERSIAESYYQVVYQKIQLVILFIYE
jgi:uncharacterized protein YhhL (DUF1145 family)